MGKILNLEGKKFGRLTVLRVVKLLPQRGVLWECSCECGTLCEKRATLLYRGSVKSCGCLRIETAITNGKKVRVGETNAKWKGKGPIPGKMLTSLKSGASKRGLEFNITLDDMYDQLLLQNYKCALTGDVLYFQKTSRGQKEANASLDRIDSSKGYVKGNIQWVLKNINRMKFDLSQELLIELCEKVTKNAKPRNP